MQPHGFWAHSLGVCGVCRVCEFAGTNLFFEQGNIEFVYTLGVCKPHLEVLTHNLCSPDAIQHTVLYPSDMY